MRMWGEVDSGRCLSHIWIGFYLFGRLVFYSIALVVSGYVYTGCS